MAERGSTAARTAPKDVDTYLAALPPDARTALEQLRKDIRAAAPETTEAISYQMPCFKYHGVLVWYAAWKDHCSLYPGSKAVIESLRDELKDYSLDKGTIRFPVDKPLPAALVRKIVEARMRENESRKAR